jgi:hypothetical protein
MNQKLFELIYLMIVRQELKPQDAYDMLRDFFRLTEISEREKAKESSQESKEWEPLDLSKWPGQIIDNPAYPLICGDGITWTGGPVSTTYTNGATAVTSAHTIASNTDDQTSITCTASVATAAADQND